MNLYRTFILFLLTAGIYSPLIAQSFAEESEQCALDNNLTGMAVLVNCNGQTLAQYYYGHSDIARGIKTDVGTHFRIASISKTVTATALMLLYQDGKFDLDDDISQYLGYSVRNPNFPNKIITFRMLLSHTSGLNDGSGYSGFLSDTYNQSPPPAISELIVQGGDYYTGNMWLNHEPGAYFNYANINYGLIGTLIECLSEQRFDNFVHEQLLLPLGISGSFNIQDIKHPDSISVLYRNGVPQADNYGGVLPEPFDSAGYIIGTNGAVFAPQGGLRISAPDLAKFMQMHADYGRAGDIQFIDSSIIALMHSPQWTYNGTNGNNYYNLFNEWGLGLHITTNTPNGDIVIDEEKFCGHPGEAYGLISDMYFGKEKNFGLIFISNGYYGSAGYEWGDYSAFYLPEETIFSIAEDHFYHDCTAPVSNTEPAVEGAALFRYSKNTEQIEFSESFSGTVQIFNTEGKTVFRQELKHRNSVTIPNLHKGLYIIHASNQEKAYSQKILFLSN